jgi:hypothetical protein
MRPHFGPPTLDVERPDIGQALAAKVSAKVFQSVGFAPRVFVFYRRVGAVVFVCELPERNLVALGARQKFSLEIFVLLRDLERLR